MSLVIGLTGPNASGKGEVGDYLAQRGFKLHSLSDIVREEAAAHGLAPEREHLIRIGNELRRQLEIPADGDTDPNRRFTIESVNCLGCCSLAPVMMIEDHVAGHLTPTGAWQELERTEAEA